MTVNDLFVSTVPLFAADSQAPVARCFFERFLLDVAKENVLTPLVTLVKNRSLQQINNPLTVTLRL